MRLAPSLLLVLSLLHTPSIQAEERYTVITESTRLYLAPSEDASWFSVHTFARPSHAPVAYPVTDQREGWLEITTTGEPTSLDHCVSKGHSRAFVGLELRLWVRERDAQPVLTQPFEVDKFTLLSGVVLNDGALTLLAKDVGLSTLPEGIDDALTGKVYTPHGTKAGSGEVCGDVMVEGTAGCERPWRVVRKAQVDENEDSITYDATLMSANRCVLKRAQITRSRNHSTKDGGKMLASLFGTRGDSPVEVPVFEVAPGAIVYSTRGEELGRVVGDSSALFYFEATSGHETLRCLRAITDCVMGTTCNGSKTAVSFCFDADQVVEATASVHPGWMPVGSGGLRAFPPETDPTRESITAEVIEGADITSADALEGTGLKDSPKRKKIKIAVESGPLTMKGGDPELESAATRIFDKQMKGIERCYKRVVQKHGAQSGSVTIEIEVSEGGRVIRAEVVNDEVGKNLGECLRKKITRWRFPKSDDPWLVRKHWQALVMVSARA